MVNYKSKQYKAAGITRTTYHKRRRRVIPAPKTYYLVVYCGKRSSWDVELVLADKTYQEVKKYRNKLVSTLRPQGCLDECPILRSIVTTWVKNNHPGIDLKEEPINILSFHYTAKAREEYDYHVVQKI